MKVGSKVVHSSFGEGVVLSLGDSIVVDFGGFEISFPNDNELRVL